MLRVLTTDSFATFTRFKSDIELVAAAIHSLGHIAAVGDVEGKITFLKDWNVKVSFLKNRGNQPIPNLQIPKQKYCLVFFKKGFPDLYHLSPRRDQTLARPAIGMLMLQVVYPSLPVVTPCSAVVRRQC